MKTVHKCIAAGKRVIEGKDDKADKVLRWPENPRLEIESLANHMPDAPAVVIAGFDSQILHHDASNVWKSTEGQLDKLPNKPTEGRKLWFDGKVIRLNWDFQPGQSGSTRIDQLVATVLNYAKVMTASDPSNPITPETAARQMGLTSSDITSVLARLNDGKAE